MLGYSLLSRLVQRTQLLKGIGSNDGVASSSSLLLV